MSETNTSIVLEWKKTDFPSLILHDGKREYAQVFPLFDKIVGEWETLDCYGICEFDSIEEGMEFCMRNVSRVIICQ